MLRSSTSCCTTGSRGCRGNWAVFVLAAAIFPWAVRDLSAQDLQPRLVAPKPRHIELQPHHRRDVVIVKFREGLTMRARAGRLVEPGMNTLARAGEAFDAIAAGRWRAMFSLPEARLTALRENAQRKRGRQISDLNLWFYLVLDPAIDAQEAIDTLNRFDFVEIALPLEEPPPPPLPPDFEDEQIYLGDLPFGIEAFSAWAEFGQRGGGVRICDLEYSWNYDHLDLPPATHVGPAPLDPFNDTNHGTAVLGMLASIDNGWGTTGIAPDVQLFTAAVNIDVGGVSVYDVAGAVLRAVDVLQPGDIMLIEQQAAGPLYTGASGQYGLVPVEWRVPTYDAILTAVGNGIIVVEAAGNGYQDLDDIIYGYGHAPFKEENDSGALIIGAGAANGDELDFSNYGSTVDLQGWGGNIWSTGYSNAWASEGINLYYTQNFGGTSGASAMVAGVCALLQSNYEAITGVRLTIDEMKQWLQLTGKRQPAFGSGPLFNIGPRPLARTAVDVATRPIHLFLVDPLPDIHPPGQTMPLRVEISPALGAYVPGTATLRYRFGNGPFRSIPMTPEAGSTTIFTAELPEVFCGEQPKFYFQAMADDGTLQTDPFNAPTTVHTFDIGVETMSTLLDEDFEDGLPVGWSATGLWHVSNTCVNIPLCGGTQWAYYGQDVNCTYNVTGTAGRLTLPTILFPPAEPNMIQQLTICHQVATEGALSFDKADLLVDGVVLHTFTDTAWTTETIELPFLIDGGFDLVFRFDTQDSADNQHQGWQIDGITITRQSTFCDLLRPCPADCAGDDRVVNVVDLLALLSNWGVAGGACDFAPVEAPDGVVNVIDLLELIATWGPCGP